MCPVCPPPVPTPLCPPAPVPPIPVSPVSHDLSDEDQPLAGAAEGEAGGGAALGPAGLHGGTGWHRAGGGSAGGGRGGGPGELARHGAGPGGARRHAIGRRGKPLLGMNEEGAPGAGPRGLGATSRDRAGRGNPRLGVPGGGAWSAELPAMIGSGVLGGGAEGGRGLERGTPCAWQWAGLGAGEAPGGGGKATPRGGAWRGQGRGSPGIGGGGGSLRGFGGPWGGSGGIQRGVGRAVGSLGMPRAVSRGRGAALGFWGDSADVGSAPPAGCGQGRNGVGGGSLWEMGAPTFIEHPEMGRGKPPPCGPRNGGPLHSSKGAPAKTKGTRMTPPALGSPPQSTKKWGGGEPRCGVTVRVRGSGGFRGAAPPRGRSRAPPAGSCPRTAAAPPAPAGLGASLGGHRTGGRGRHCRGGGAGARGARGCTTLPVGGGTGVCY